MFDLLFRLCVLGDGISVDLRAWNGCCLEQHVSSSTDAKYMLLSKLTPNTLYVNRDSREMRTGNECSTVSKHQKLTREPPPEGRRAQAHAVLGQQSATL